MAYERTVWKNREVEYPRRYIITDNGDGTVTIEPSPGNIIEPGTPIIAAFMNNIEQGIEDAHNAIDEHKANYATQDTLGHIKLSDIPSTADDIGAFGPSNYGNIVSSTVDLTLNLSHANTVLVYGTTSARIITIPNNSSVPFPIGTQITVIRNSTGTVTFVPASGVTLNSKDNKRSIDGRYASATLIKTDINTWMLIGALV